MTGWSCQKSVHKTAFILPKARRLPSCRCLYVAEGRNCDDVLKGTEKLCRIHARFVQNNDPKGFAFYPLFVSMACRIAAPSTGRNASPVMYGVTIDM